MYGAPDMGPGVLSAQAPSLLQLLYAGERAAPSCKSESRKGKVHRSPQPVTNKHELPNSRMCISLSLSLCASRSA